MNRFPNKGQKRCQIDLKTRLKASHNGGCNDERIIALVKFLARRAAVEDYQQHKRSSATPDKIKGGY